MHPLSYGLVMPIPLQIIIFSASPAQNLCSVWLKKTWQKMERDGCTRKFDFGNSPITRTKDGRKMFIKQLVANWGCRWYQGAYLSVHSWNHAWDYTVFLNYFNNNNKKKINLLALEYLAFSTWQPLDWQRRRIPSCSEQPQRNPTNGSLLILQKVFWGREYFILL